MCGKPCSGFSVNGLGGGKELFLCIFSFFGNLFVWKISFSSLLTFKIWKLSSPFCLIYGSRNLKKCLYMEVGLYSDMSRSKKNAFIPTKIESLNGIQYTAKQCVVCWIMCGKLPLM